MSIQRHLLFIKVKILDCLKNETGEIIMDKETIDKARLSVEKMVAIGR